MVDLTITMGNIIQIAVIGVGGIVAVIAVRNSVTNLGRDLTRMETDFFDMKIEIKKVGEVLLKMAVTDNRLTNVEQDIRGIEQDVREMKHGQGFVQREIGGEYPR